MIEGAAPSPVPSTSSSGLTGGSRPQEGSASAQDSRVKPEDDDLAVGAQAHGMIRFAQLLEALTFTPARNGKLRLIEEYFSDTPDPERGWALASLTGELVFREAKPAALRDLVYSRVDRELFGWSYDYVGDLAETVALIWPEPSRILATSSSGSTRGSRPKEDSASARDPRVKPEDDASKNKVLSLTDIVDALRKSKRADVKALIEPWLDALDATGRWALLKLVTGGLRVGVSARLAKTALAEWSGVAVEEIEEVWHGIEPPYTELFAWLSGHAGRPHPGEKPVFLPLMLSTPIEETDFPNYRAEDYLAEWKWDGIRVQLANRGGEARIWSRSGDDISKAFPDVLAAIPDGVVLDGELLVGERGEVAPFNDLQQRLNRKTATPQMLEKYPAFVRLYDILHVNGGDVRGQKQTARRELLEAWYGATPRPRLDLSPVIPIVAWDEIAALRAGARAEGIEGLMLKRRDTPYVSGRPKGPWFKWKRDALTLDCVMMYAQRGHGKRSSFYSDYTFGAWKGEELVPVGKAYSGFTDQELVKLDRWVRNNTTKRYGPVREVSPGLVLEIAFDSAHLSTRHKSGLAMRFPRVHRIRWDKPIEEADTVETLAALIAAPAPGDSTAPSPGDGGG